MATGVFGCRRFLLGTSRRQHGTGIDERLFVGAGGHPLAGRHLGAHRDPLIVDPPSLVLPESLVPKE